MNCARGPQADVLCHVNVYRPEADSVSRISRFRPRETEMAGLIRADPIRERTALHAMHYDALLGTDLEAAPVTEIRPPSASGFFQARFE